VKNVKNRKSEGKNRHRQTGNSEKQNRMSKVRQHSQGEEK
jgi:hypothetical protein